MRVLLGGETAAGRSIMLRAWTDVSGVSKSTWASGGEVYMKRQAWRWSVCLVMEAAFGRIVKVEIPTLTPSAVTA
jgi:hypothetical protein